MMKFLLVRDIGPLANPGELDAAARIPRPKVPSCELNPPASGNGSDYTTDCLGARAESIRGQVAQ
jgi:hypothetical protein